MSEPMTYSEFSIRRREHTLFDRGAFDRVEVSLLERERLIEHRDEMAKMVADLSDKFNRVFPEVTEKVGGP